MDLPSCLGSRFEEAAAVVEEADDEQERGDDADNGSKPIGEDERGRVVDGRGKFESEQALTNITRIAWTELAEEKADGPENVQENGGVVAPAIEFKQANAADGE